MRKASSSEEIDKEVDVKKRSSRRKSEPRKPKAVVEETCRELEVQLQRFQTKAAQDDKRSKNDSLKVEQGDQIELEANGPGDQSGGREEDSRKRTAETGESATTRKQVEAQRQRLEEALLLAKERKRAEELTRDPKSRSIAGSMNSQPENEEDWMPSLGESEVKAMDVASTEKGIAPFANDGDLVDHVLERLSSSSSQSRASALNDLSGIASSLAFPIITKAFDDPSLEVRNAAAKALYSLESNPASTFARALREANIQRSRQIGSSLAASGLASDALRSLVGSNREKTHEALALLFLMAKAGEIRPLMSTIEDDQNLEIRLAVINLLALSGRAEIIPPFRRLAVRGSLPAEVRSAVMEAIYQISSQQRETAGRWPGA
jgi:HEAT repeat protein